MSSRAISKIERTRSCSEHSTSPTSFLRLSCKPRTSVATPELSNERIEELAALRALIEVELADGYLIDPSVSIEIAKHRPFYILGEVRAPGRYDYVSNMSVFNAVAMAGGFTYRAKQGHVKVRRPEAGKAYEEQERSLSAKVEPGDIIIVEERFF